MIVRYVQADVLRDTFYIIAVYITCTFGSRIATALLFSQTFFNTGKSDARDTGAGKVGRDSRSGVPARCPDR